MKHSSNPVRLLAEVVAIVAIAETLVMLVLPVLVPGLTGLAAGLVDVALLVLLSSPAVYWRCMAALRRQAAPHTNGQSNTQKLSVTTAIGMTAAAQLAGLAVTAGLVAWQKHDLDKERLVQFDRAAERIEAEVKRRFTQPLYGLKGARGAYAASTEITRREFRAYVESRDLPSEFPGIRGFGFIERVERPDLEAFVARERADHAPEFAVRTQGDAADLFVIKYIEPLADNRAAFGFDAGQEAVRREAAERAMLTGQPSLTGKIFLVQDGRQSPGMLYLLPVYRRGADPGTPAQHKQALVGLLYAPIVASEMFGSLTSTANETLRTELFDGDTLQAERLLFDSGQPSQDPALLSVVRPIEVGGRILQLRLSSTPAFIAAQDRSNMALAGVAGALASLLAAFTVWLLAVGRLRAQRLAARMTNDLDRLARVVQHTSNSVLITDTQMRVTWVNEGFTRLTGYTIEEAKGQTPGELLDSGKADPIVIEKLRTAAMRGEACRVEVLNRKKDGTDYWIDIEVQPTHDAKGVLVGFMEIGSDITVQKQAQKTLAESEAFLDRAGRIAGVGGWRMNLKDNTVKWSAEIRRIHGVADDFVPTLERVLHFYAPEARPLLQAAVQRGLETGQSWDMELPLVTATGRAVWVRAVGEVEFENGIPVMLIGALQDITERRRRDEDLHILESSIGRINDVVLITKAQPLHGTGPEIVYVNRAFESVTGYTQAEALGHTPRMLQGPDTDPATLERITKALERGEPITEELLNYAKDGTPYWIELALSPIRSETGELTHFVAVERDITERRKLNQAISKSNQLMTDVLQNLPCGLSVFDGNLVLVAQNPQLRSLLNLPDSLFSGAETTFEQIIRYNAEAGEYGPGDVAAIVAAVTERVRHPVAHVFERIRPNGVPLEIRGTPLPGGGFISTYVDISESKKTQHQLTEALEAAQQASISKSQFVANMSHEIRTPMNAILGMLKLLQSTDLSVRQMDYAAKTEGAARSLLGLLNDILDFSKVEAGKMTLDPRPFRVDRLMRDLSVILSANMGSKSIEVLFDIDPAMPKCLLGDDMRLQQVLINLGGNAIKFTEQGEVVLRLQVLEQTADDVLVGFSVKDSGIGIAPENQTHIFNGFSQAEASTTRRFGGTGLGLAISSRLVGLLGGTLAVDSALGQGSSFHFQIRFALAQMPASDTATPAIPGITLGALTTLVVDDNDVTREVLQHMLQPLGWQVDMAASGALAIERMQARAAKGLPPYDAIFMDWQMPEMDGWETSQRIRKLATGGNAPIVVMVTAHGREMLSERSPAEQALINGFLVKPVTASMVFDAVSDARAAISAAASGLNPAAPKAVVKPKRLQGMRLLVVEDNKINQMVAKGLLTQEGADVTLADDGALGVEAVASAQPPFDAVLMDVQMPVMDGYTATRTIRQEKGLTELPIIAMTANAMASDRAACLAAGMNDHVGKPFDLDQLVALLQSMTTQRGTR